MVREASDNAPSIEAEGKEGVMPLLHYRVENPSVSDGLTGPDAHGHRWRKVKPLPSGDVLIHLWGVCPREIAAAIMKTVQMNEAAEHARNDQKSRINAIESALKRKLTIPAGLEVIDLDTDEAP